MKPVCEVNSRSVNASGSDACNLAPAYPPLSGALRATAITVAPAPGEGCRDPSTQTTTCADNDRGLAGWIAHGVTLFAGKHQTSLSLQTLASMPSYSLVRAAVSVTPRGWMAYP
jgi:hypothetical protein